jgi:hypothetical protein
MPRWPAALACAPTQHTRPGALIWPPAHAVDVTITRGLTILTAEPDPL